MNLHAQQQAHERGVSFEDVDYVLMHYDSRRDARPLPRRRPAEILAANLRGNRLRVYIEKGTDEPYEVRTVAWEER
jgi:hypothetical protein